MPTASTPNNELDAHTAELQFAKDSAEATMAIAQTESFKPLTGPVLDRPTYVTRLEWIMLRSAAQRQRDPDQALTRSVNFLRFNKQLAHWQALRKQALTSKRQVLAQQLLDELPQHIRDGDIDASDAQSTRSELLTDLKQPAP